MSRARARHRCAHNAQDCRKCCLLSARAPRNQQNKGQVVKVAHTLFCAGLQICADGHVGECLLPWRYPTHASVGVCVEVSGNDVMVSDATVRRERANKVQAERKRDVKM